MLLPKVVSVNGEINNVTLNHYKQDQTHLTDITEYVGGIIKREKTGSYVMCVIIGIHI